MSDQCGDRDWQSGAICLLSADHYTTRGTRHRGYAYLGGRHPIIWGPGRRTAPFTHDTGGGE